MSAKNLIQLSLINALVKIGGRHLLDHIYLDLNPGECVVIWGLNGVGKSSLLDVLSGWRGLDQGAVFLNGENIKNLTIKTRANYLAYLTQESKVLFDDQVLELLKIFKVDLKIINHWAEILKVKNLLNRSFQSLSGGEKSKIFILKKILQLIKLSKLSKLNQENLRGSYLLLDEPMAHLDQLYQQEFLEVLLKLKQQGLGVLLVMHDLNQAWSCADRFFIYFQGCLYFCKDEQALFKNFKDFYQKDLSRGEGFVF